MHVDSSYTGNNMDDDDAAANGGRQTLTGAGCGEFGP
jgi:hypothetical protein